MYTLYFLHNKKHKNNSTIRKPVRKIFLMEMTKINVLNF